jgi:hypothetical protein
MTANRDSLNPYASPADASPALQIPLTRAEALQRVRAPTIGLMCTSTLSVAWAATTWITGTGPPKPTGMLESAAIAGVLFVLPAVLFLAAAQVLRGRVNGWSAIAIVLGLVPLGMGCVCAGIPFALWLLHVALQKEVRAALG